MERRVTGKGTDQKFGGGVRAGYRTKKLGKGMQAQMQGTSGRREREGEEWTQGPEDLESSNQNKERFQFRLGSQGRSAGAPPLRSCGLGADAPPLGLAGLLPCRLRTPTPKSSPATPTRWPGLSP